MQFLVFTDKMVDGVAAIDRQHAKLIHIINELYEIALTTNASPTLEEVFDDLARYTVEHFDYEEKLFAETGYPRLQEHHLQHEALKQRIADHHGGSHGSNDTIVAAEMLHYLKQWLNDHMMNADKDACRHLNAHGIR